MVHSASRRRGVGGVGPESDLADIKKERIGGMGRGLVCEVSIYLTDLFLYGAYQLGNMVPSNSHVRSPFQ